MHFDDQKTLSKDPTFLAKRRICPKFEFVNVEVQNHSKISYSLQKSQKVLGHNTLNKNVPSSSKIGIQKAQHYPKAVHIAKTLTEIYHTKIFTKTYPKKITCRNSIEQKSFENASLRFFQLELLFYFWRNLKCFCFFIQIWIWRKNIY